MVSSEALKHRTDHPKVIFLRVCPILRVLQIWV